MHFAAIFTVVFTFLTISLAAKYDHKQLRCLVCQNSLREFQLAVNKLDPTKTVDVGGHRLDADGNYNHKSVPQTKSELQLSELMENICERMDDYVRATYKSNGTLTLLQLIIDGKMNNDMSEVDIIQDDDLNASVKYNCEIIMQEYEDSIINLYQSGDSDITTAICTEESKLCKRTKEEL